MATQRDDVSAALLRYMSGEGTAGERDEFDRRMLEDEMFSRQAEEAEFLLIEAHADGGLPPAERAIVGAWIAASPRRVFAGRITAALERTSAVHGVRGRRMPIALWIGFAAAACLALLFTLHSVRRPQATATLVAGTRVASTKEDAASSQSDTILLDAKRLRGAEQGQPGTYLLHAGRTTRIQVLLPGAAPGKQYAGDLRRVLPGAASTATHLVGSRMVDATGKAYVEFLLPAAALPKGSYALVISSTGGSYRLQFKVDEKSP